MQIARRMILVGAALSTSSHSSLALEVADLVAEATYRGGGSGTWKLLLFANYTARLEIALTGQTAGTVVGQFRFYDIEVADGQEMAAFAKVKPLLMRPEPELHPSSYEIGLLLPNSGRLHRVTVYASAITKDSPELRIFFTIWRNIWSGIPGTPSVPTNY